MRAYVKISAEKRLISPFPQKRKGLHVALGTKCEKIGQNQYREKTDLFFIAFLFSTFCSIVFLFQIYRLFVFNKI